MSVKFSRSLPFVEMYKVAEVTIANYKPIPKCLDMPATQSCISHPPRRVVEVLPTHKNMIHLKLRNAPKMQSLNAIRTLRLVP